MKFIRKPGSFFVTDCGRFGVFRSERRAGPRGKRYTAISFRAFDMSTSLDVATAGSLADLQVRLERIAACMGGLS